jgi:hypothetical protein
MGRQLQEDPIECYRVGCALQSSVGLIMVLFYQFGPDLGVTVETVPRFFLKFFKKEVFSLEALL